MVDEELDEIEKAQQRALIKAAKERKEKKEKENKLPEKQYYDVVLEYLSPITVKYKVFAETPEEAHKMAEEGKIPPTSISKPKLAKSNILSGIVYLYGTVNRLLSIRRR